MLRSFKHQLSEKQKKKTLPNAHISSDRLALRYHVLKHVKVPQVSILHNHATVVAKKVTLSTFQKE